MKRIILAMQPVSSWASRHQWSARILISVIQMTLLLSAMLLGALVDTKVPVIIAIITAAILLICVLFYPIKQACKRMFKYSFVKQKSLDLLVGLCSFLLVFFWANHHAVVLTSHHESHSYYERNFEVMPVVHQQSAKQQKKAKRKLRRQQRKSMKKELISAIKQMKKKLPIGLRILLSIVGLAVVIAMLAGTAGLACTAACSGSPGLAVLAAVGGMTLTTLVAIQLYRFIYGRKRRPAQHNHILLNN